MTEGRSRIRHPWRVLVLLFLLGVSLISLGWTLAPEAFPSSLFVQVGVGVVLFASLLWLERNLEQSFEASIEDVKEESRRSVDEVRDRIEGVEESVAEVRSEVAQLGELGDEVRQALAERDAEIERVFDQFADGVSPRTINEILSNAERLDAVDRNGVRVQLEGSSLRLRIRRLGVAESVSAMAPVVLLVIEELDGAEIHRVAWGDNALRDVMVAVIEKLQARGEYNTAFDPDVIFERFRDTVRTAIELKIRAGRGPSDLSPVIEIPNDQWAVTTFGVECLETRYFIEKERFDETDWVPHMNEKTWVEIDKFRAAFDVARAMWQREERELEMEAPF